MAADTFIRCFPYNGSDLTIEIRENTGTANIIDPIDGVTVIGTENTHDIRSKANGLTSISITPGSTGDTLTDAALDNLWVCAYKIGSGDKVYAGVDDTLVTHFSKVVSGNTITCLDGTNTFTSGTAVTVYHLVDGTEDTVSGVRTKDIPDSLVRIVKAMKQAVDDLSSSEVYNAAVAQQFSKN